MKFLLHPPLLEKLVKALGDLLKNVPCERFIGRTFAVEEHGYHEIT